ncbi:AfsR/SARP family transcriptional regulator [Amycolatopsis nigrescens]|uniref:AfsR/SARP family transcriptional regulator n=1 Tax=Amycolatopsis nigrescens TaxID=381445 RepID=UPI00036D1364|nr:tetratricopeptide repeat protein [Amycolatopsis nigrescens]
MTVEFQVLGDLEVHHDGRLIDVGSLRQRYVLAALLADANQPVSVDQLVDRVWGGSPPHRPRETLYSYLSRLRRILAVGDVRIARRPGGYLLAVDPAAVDLHRFRELVGQARKIEGDARALAVFDQVLGLWHGDAFATLETPWFAAMRETLDQERLAAELDRNDVALRLGLHTKLLVEVSARAVAHPLDERLAGQLMLTLYRCGRSAAAVQAFQTVRRALVNELGIEPGDELQRLHQQVLTGKVAERPQETARPAGCNYLPRDIDDFTGRDLELDQLIATLPMVEGANLAVLINAIDGMAGVGKTTLAIHAGHQLTDRYPDAQLFIDLHAHTAGHEPTEPAAALDTLLRQLGVPGERIPDGLEERAGFWRAELANRRTLVVLDNAASAAQVRPLLPGNPACLVLITSRQQLSDLEAAHTFSTDVLRPEEAVTLFARAVGNERVTAERGWADEVVRLCGYLPLAIRIIASRLRTRPTWTIRHVAERMRGQQRLRELATGDRSVAAAFTLSYQHLDAGHKRLFRLLGLHPGTDFDAYQAAALAGIELDEADRLLEELLDVHLLRQPTSGRYQFHDLLRAYAAQLVTEAETDDSRCAALTGMFDHYLHVASAAMDAVYPKEKHHRPVVSAPGTPAPPLSDSHEAWSWLETERHNLLAAAAHADSRGWHAYTGYLSTILYRYLDIGGYRDEALTLHTHALTTARDTGDRDLETKALHGLGIVYWRLGRYDQALIHLEEGLELTREVGDRVLERRAVGDVGLVYWRMGQLDQAHVYLKQALTLAKEAGDRDVEGRALDNLGLVCWHAKRYDEGLIYLEEGLALAQRSGHRHIEGYALYGLGLVNGGLGRVEQALTHLEQALALAREAGNRDLESEVLNGLGETATSSPTDALAHHQQALAISGVIGNRHEEARAHRGIADAHRKFGRLPAARRHWQHALGLYTDLGVPETEDVRRQLEDCNSQNPIT